MPISDRVLPVALLLSIGVGMTSAYALDGRKSPDSIPELPGVGAVVRPPAPLDGAGPTHALEFHPGSLTPALKVIEDAFNKGDPVAGWKLGRMFADGVGGVDRNPARAFHYFRAVYLQATTGNQDDEMGPEVRMVLADASVQLGLYYLKGIPNSDVKADLTRAYNIFDYAASFLGNADAQFYLGRMYQDGQGVARESKLAVKWFILAANQGQYEAQLRYGSLLIEGKLVQSDVPKGLMWLRVAVDSAPEGEARDAVRAIHAAAIDQATPDERATADVLYERWKQQRPKTSAVNVRP